MRPVTKVRLLAPPQDVQPALGRLISALGAYCSFSERPLHDYAGLWNPSSSDLATDQDRASDDLLLIDVSTQRIAQASRLTPWPELLRPDVDLTFTLDDRSPITYAPQEVQVTYIDETGAPVGDPVLETFVFATGHTDAAASTIAAYGLNSAWYDAGRAELRIPLADHLAMVDTRLQEQTAAWTKATASAERLSSIPDPEHARVFVDHVRLTVAATGYWSVWATVFWRRFSNPQMLRRLLVGPAGDTGPSDRLRSTGAAPGPQVFPGTRLDGLP